MMIKLNNIDFIVCWQKSLIKFIVTGLCALFLAGICLAQSTQPTNPTQPKEPAKPNQPTNPTQPKQPNEPAQPAQPANPTQPTNPGNQTQPANPSNPGNPSQPTNPSQNPSQNPINPANPSNPSNPANPTNPTQPQQSTNPINPANTSPKVNNQPAGAGNPQTSSPQGQKIGTAGGVAPAELPLPPPPIKPDFKSPNRPLPSAERVGVSMSEQSPLTLNEALALALENNTDIETSRIDVRIAEFDLRAKRGVFDPRLVGESFFQKSVTPNASTLGAANGATRTTNFTGNFGFQGSTPIAGGTYQSSFDSSRQTTDAPFTQLNPQYPTAFNFNYTQPLWRGLRIDDNRRQIQIAKKT